LLNSVARVLQQGPPLRHAHPDATLFGARSHDPSFPSDHASRIFAIAVAVFLFDRLVGGIFIAAAAAIAIGRVVTGVH